MVVAVIAGEDLRLVGESPERGGVHNAVTVALVGAAKRVRFLVMYPAGGVDGVHRPGGEHQLLAGSPIGLTPVGGGHGMASAAALVNCSQSASSDCGSTRTPATVGIKFTSPLHRGTMCQWR